MTEAHRCEVWVFATARVEDHVAGAGAVLQDGRIPEAEHPQPAAPEIVGAARIIGNLLRVLAAIEFDDAVETAVNRAVKKASQRIWGRRPVVETMVLRL